MPLEQYFEIIQEGSGQDFDPLLVEIFMDVRDKVEDIHHRMNDTPKEVSGEISDKKK